MEKQKFNVKRGQVYFVDLGSGYGSEQGGIRPAIVVTVNSINKASPVIGVVTMSSKLKRMDLGTHILIKTRPELLASDSIALVETFRTIDKSRLLYYKGTLNSEEMEKISAQLKWVLDLK